MRILLLVVFCLLYISSKAQFVPVQQTIKTPNGPVKITTYTHQPNMFGTPNYAYSIDFVFKTSMTIFGKDETVRNIRVQYDASSKTHVLKELGNKKKELMVYKPSDTKQISRLYDGKLQVGIPADSCWLFKISSGRITTYSYLPTDQKATLSAIQQGENGPILILNQENLEALTPSASERIQKLIEEQKFWRAIELYNKSDKSE
jgi:hypothetical protein